MAEPRDDLLELDACLARVPMPDSLEARIVFATTMQAVRPSPVRRSLGVALAFAAGVAVAFAALGGWPAKRDAGSSVATKAVEPGPAVVDTEPDSVAPTRPAPGLSLISDACEWSEADELLRFDAGCRIRLAQPAMEIEIWTPTRLSPITGGVEVREGTAMFSVEHVDDVEHPARVKVSGGTIEVLGTRFAIHQARREGHVDLIEGAIQFRTLDGGVEAIEAGQRYRWRELVELPPDRLPAEVPKPLEPTPKSTLDEDLAEVARLRRAGEIDAAIAKLDALAREQSDRRTLEVISYERGTLVERSATASSACEFWLEHRRSFPGGRYDVEIARRLEQLECVPE
jgi:hypothetical protein